MIYQTVEVVATPISPSLAFSPKITPTGAVFAYTIETAIQETSFGCPAEQTAQHIANLAKHMYGASVTEKFAATMKILGSVIDGTNTNEFWVAAVDDILIEIQKEVEEIVLNDKKTWQILSSTNVLPGVADIWTFTCNGTEYKIDIFRDVFTIRDSDGVVSHGLPKGSDVVRWILNFNDGAPSA